MFRVAHINEGGYIRTVGNIHGHPTKTIHRESRNIQTWAGICHETLADARLEWEQHTETKVILELDREGGVCAIWMADRQRDKLVPRLNKWKGCYGLWPIRKLNEGR